MGRISTGVGLISGINSADIIDQLMAIEARPKDQIQTRIDSITQQKLAYTDLTARLTGLQLNGQTLSKASTFQNATASSSDEGVATATAAAGAAVGSYQLQVARLVTTQQVVSRGYEDFNSSKLEAGTISIGVGGGELSKLDQLSDLNGGAGVRRGVFRITDRSGASAVIDTTAAVTLQDIVKKINTSLTVQVRASLKGDKVVLDDTTGKTASDLIVQDIGDGSAAADLGLVGDVAGNTLTGTDINFLGSNTTLAQLNDGRGVRRADSGADFAIQPGDGGAAIDVTLATATSVADVIDAINTASAGRVTAELVPGGNGIKLTDASGGGGAFTVTALNSSLAAHDLGIETTGSGGIINGGDLLAGLGTVLVSSLNGGQGLTLGTIAIKDRANTASIDVDLSAAKSIQDVLDAINGSGAQVKASISSAGDAIQIADTSGGTGLLQIDDTGGGATAQDLGLAGSFDTSTTAVKGTNLHRQYVSENTLLSDYNGGKGVASGTIKITGSTGQTANISIGTNQVTLGDVIKQINNRGIGVTASINANGNGVLLTDTAGGTLKLKVTDVDSTTAKDLLIAGEATATTIDGAQEKTIDITANDTLATLQTKINTLNFGVSASIINDGSGLAPFRLSLTAKHSGRDGRVIFDSGSTGLDTHNLVEAQDAAVFLGGLGSEQPLLIRSSSNQITGAIKGVTINLNGVSDSPVSLNITQNADAAVDQINSFVEGFNGLIDKIADLTKFDTTTNQGGLLLGESTVQSVQNGIYAALSTVVPNNGRYRLLADVGVTLIDGAKLSFDEEKLRAAYADDPEGVQRLFTAVQKSTDSAGASVSTNIGIGGVLADQIKKLIDPVDGVITRENKTLDDRTTQFQDRISQLNDLLETKRTRLQLQFSNLESVLAGLQSQQQALGAITSFKSIAASASSSSK